MKASVSKINTATRCLKKYSYGYIEGIEKILQDAKPQLGVIGHACLEAHFRGQDWTAPIAKYEADLRKLMDEERELYAHIPSELYRMVRGYLNYWKRVDEGIEVLAVELPFEVPTPGGNTYEGRIDLIYRDAEGVWVLDHKFVKQVPSEAMRYLDAQTNMYYYAATRPEIAEAVGYKPEEVMGVVFDYIRTKPPTTPKVLKAGTMSKAAIDTDVETYLTALRTAGLDPHDYMDMLEKLKSNVFFKRTRVPRPERLTANILNEFDDACWMLRSLADEETWGDTPPLPRSITRDCSWDCQFSELCFAELSGINSDFIREQSYQPRTKKEEVVNGSDEQE